MTDSRDVMAEFNLKLDAYISDLKDGIERHFGRLTELVADAPFIEGQGDTSTKRMTGPESRSEEPSCDRPGTADQP